MPRRPRVLSSTGIYHIILRSVNQHIVFEEDSDYQKFLFILSACVKKYDSQIYAFCLMDNHIHLLIHSRSGHLFQERYYSVAIENDSSFLSVLAYIHNNPVKANIVRYPSEYRWSSYNAYYGAKDSVVNVSFAYSICGSKESLIRYFSHENEVADDELFVNDHRETAHFLTDEKALSIFRSYTNLSSTSDVIHLKKTKRNDYIRGLREKGLTINQVARLMDVSATTVKRLCKMNH